MMASRGKQKVGSVGEGLISATSPDSKETSLAKTYRPLWEAQNSTLLHCRSRLQPRAQPSHRVRLWLPSPKAAPRRQKRWTTQTQAGDMDCRGRKQNRRARGCGHSRPSRAGTMSKQDPMLATSMIKWSAICQTEDPSAPSREARHSNPSKSTELKVGGACLGLQEEQSTRSDASANKGPTEAYLRIVSSAGSRGTAQTIIRQITLL
jgi:hypothetical protein